MCDIDLVLCASAEPQMLKARGGGGGAGRAQNWAGDGCEACVQCEFLRQLVCDLISQLVCGASLACLYLCHTVLASHGGDVDGRGDHGDSNDDDDVLSVLMTTAR